MAKETLQAKWIWFTNNQRNTYNATAIAEKHFTVSQCRSAEMIITADSFYRLYINDEWVSDGPCRSWPEHFQYDVVNVQKYLKKGNNTIRIIARHYGIGDMHGIYQQPGLLCQLSLKMKNRTQVIKTDKTWSIAQAKAWSSNTPKISIQMEPAERYDARKETPLRFKKAVEICDATKGPWKNLKPRDVALLSRKAVSPARFVTANVAAFHSQVFCVPVARLCNQNPVKASFTVTAACGMATEITVRKKTTLILNMTGWQCAIDGKISKTGKYTLAAGKHLLLVMADSVACKHLMDKTIALNADAPLKLTNPLKASHENPWAFLKFKQFSLKHTDDLYWPMNTVQEPEYEKTETQYSTFKQQLLKSVVNKDACRKSLTDSALLLASSKMFVENANWEFQHQEIIKSADHLVSDPFACIQNNAETTSIKPSPNGDIELVYDLGEQNLGYWQFDLEAKAGTVIDMFAVEHLFEDNRPQHAMLNHNGFRYITRDGRNRFTSIKMRAGRYLFVTLRKMTAPVKIHHLGLTESTYPIQSIGKFSCSDSGLNRIWDISERTVKLCMTDTYLDCPLYEQTLWVGDARNESLFGYLLYDAQDISKRCIRLAAESLERYPIVGCQVPSSWDCLLPAWSFLWGISVWEYYWYSGDAAFVRKMWPAIVKNLKGANELLNESGLFSGPFWNMFDWSDIDQNHETVLHNSMLMVAALDAAIQCGKVLKKAKQVKTWQQQRKQLIQAINTTWNHGKNSYPDSIHEDGTVSKSTSQHTSFLALLYDIVRPKQKAHALKNTLNPPKSMVRVGSPFAMFYLYECLEKMGLYDELIQSVYDNFLPMLKADATTVWECFPGNSLTPDITGGGPTRSHCHAWSSAPVYFLSRISLGIRQSAPGGKAYQISPWVKNLSWAKGQVATCHGPLAVEWQKTGKTLSVSINAPKETTVKFVRNTTHKGCKVSIYGI